MDASRTSKKFSVVTGDLVRAPRRQSGATASHAERLATAAAVQSSSKVQLLVHDAARGRYNCSDACPVLEKHGASTSDWEPLSMPASGKRLRSANSDGPGTGARKGVFASLASRSSLSTNTTRAHSSLLHRPNPTSCIVSPPHLLANPPALCDRGLKFRGWTDPFQLHPTL